MDASESAQRYIGLVDEATKLEVQALTQEDLSTDALWHRYGEALGLAATGEDTAEAAKKSFKRRLSDLRKAFCESDEVQAVLGDPALSAQIDLALVFAGVLLDNHFGGVNIALIAVLVAKIGIHKLCQSDEL